MSQKSDPAATGELFLQQQGAELSMLCTHSFILSNYMTEVVNLLSERNIYWKFTGNIQNPEKISFILLHINMFVANFLNGLFRDFGKTYL